METNIKIATFWNRVIAFIIDSLILGAIGYLIALTMQDFLVRMGSFATISGLIITVVYQTIGNSKIMNGQTYGKRMLDIQVTDIEGNTISVEKSLLRSLAFSCPYFLQKVTWPVPSSINILVSSILLSLVLGTVIVYIFNKATRQSLHDIITGTYVVNLVKKEVTESLPTITRAPFYIWGIAVLLLVSGSLFEFLRYGDGLKSLFKTKEIIDSYPGVMSSSVTNNTTNSNGNITKWYEVKLWVTELPVGSVMDEANTKKIVQTILNSDSNINGYDYIVVEYIREFDIGIASKKNLKSVRQTPAKWREIVSQ